MRDVSERGTARRRGGERGAALITAILISMMLLAAGAAVITATSLSAGSSFDATTEVQAYYGAEAGLQAALNVLRGNVAPGATLPAGTKMSFRTAVDLATSNKAGDASTVARLSGWLTYTGDRVTVSPAYTQANGIAYRLVITDPDATPAPAEPDRLLVQSIGIGPRGAIKQMQMVVRKGAFDFEAPSTLVLRGADGSPTSPLTYNNGPSNSKSYSGHDAYSAGTVLPFAGVTNATDQGVVSASITAHHPGTVADPKVQVVPNSDLPEWLQTANAARALVNDLRDTAEETGRRFSSYPSGNAGSGTNMKLTFVDGDAVMNGSTGGGAGLLVVTGTLTVSGNVSFNGLIMVLGRGVVTRSGGGGGDLYGAMVVARFNSTGDFLAPTWDSSGGGNSTYAYNSDMVRRALNTLGTKVESVHEY